MTASSEVGDLIHSLIALRHDLHANPELAYAEHRTAARVSKILVGAGIDVHTGIGGTGLVGVLKNGRSRRSIGLRADMDALPMQEAGCLPHKSTVPSVFHGCGHDGHVVMLLGAAQHLARTRRFDGTINFIFQPAEEGQAGARAMIEDGLFERFPCDRIFALHNWPNLPVGTVSTRPGPIMAAADRFEILLTGRGGHAGMPHKAIDSIQAGAALVNALNAIVSRCVPATSTAVLSVTRIEGGHSHNVIPESVRLGGTVRTFDAGVRDQIELTIRQAVAGVSATYGVTAQIDYDRYYPATVNDADAAADALAAARTVATGTLAAEPAFMSEDFSFMLERCPGAYIWLGQAGDRTAAALHSPSYDFNDDVIETGLRLHVALAERWLRGS